MQPRRREVLGATYCIPLEGHSGYLLYSPLARTAFVANAGMVNVIADLRAGQRLDESSIDPSTLRFMQEVGLVGGSGNLVAAAPRSRRVIHVDVPRSVGQNGGVTTATRALLDGCGAEGTPIDITYAGSVTPEGAWSSLERLHTVVANYASALLRDVRFFVHLDGLPNHDQCAWLASWINGTRLRVGLAADPLPVCRHFDALGMPYEVQLQVKESDAVNLTTGLRALLCGCDVRTIVIEPAWTMSVGDVMTTHASEFIEACRKAALIAREHSRSLWVSGTHIGKRVDFGGIESRASVVESSGAVRDLALRGTPPYCAGCFASGTCAGDTLMSPADFSGSERCQLVRELTRDNLLDAIRSAGGLAWVGGDL
jgi:hypothetical protein